MTTLGKPAAPKTKQPNLERQALVFTISLYLFICIGLLVVHYAAPEPPPETGSSSSTSPYNP
ncbi:hypothetical protein ABT160_05880 [Streptomyces sp. NPDC001941]|uniref:hypothetical protein n=1 Tax=Streptomyces sp. NPDC001941 TaxID=3154659 RepID=UPI00331A1C5A